MKKCVIMTLIFSFFWFFLLNKITLAFEYTLEPSLSLSEEYNDNIFLDPSDRESDFITYVSPGIDITARTINSQLKLGYSPSFSFYSSNSELNETAHRFSANGNFTLSERLSLTLMDTFVKSSELSDIRTIEDLGPVTGRIERRLHTISGSVSYRLRNNLFFTAGASYFDTDYEEPGFDEVKSYSGNTGLSYRYSERTTVSANARYTKYDYKLDSDATGQDYTLGVIRKLTPTLTLSLTGGLIITEIEETGESDTGFSSGVDLTKSFTRGNATVSYRRTVIPGIESGTPIESQTISLSLTRPMTEKFTASLSASYSNFESIEPDLEDTDETAFNTDLSYSLRPWASLALSYRYVDHNDKIFDTGDYYNHIMFLTLRLSYTKRL